MAALFLLGLHSTLFGPVKYAILPQHLKEEELIGGNALVEAGTFVAILIGTLAGGLLAGAGGRSGLGGCCRLRRRSARLAGQPRHPGGARAGAANCRQSQSADRDLAQHRLSPREPHGLPLHPRHLVVLALRCAVPRAVPGLREERHRRQRRAGDAVLATFTIGIGIGSLLCERMSAKHVELGLVPFGSIGLTCSASISASRRCPVGRPGAAGGGALLAHAAPGASCFDLFAIGLFGGFFIVPLYALVQLRSAPEQRARIIAANNIPTRCSWSSVAGRRRDWLGPGCRSRAVRRCRRLQCGGRTLHLRPGAGVPAALPGLAADPFLLQAEETRRRTHPRTKARRWSSANHVSFVDR